MTPLRLMVVDDERDVKMLFEQRFRRELKAGTVAFLFAYSGEEALTMLRHHETADVVLILSDINMPGMTGLELLKHIKAEMPDRQVIMVTAYGDENTRRTAADFGADGFIAKPINFDDLKKRILEHLEEQKP
jgi:CheY-like chemotaxis protein